MKIKNKSESFYINILIYIAILSIPLYSLRFDIFEISFSILTINLFLLSSILYYTNYKYIYKTLQKDFIFWIFVFLFILSFIVPLALNPTIHGFGVFIEWLLLPIITSFLILTQILLDKKTPFHIQNTLIITLFLVSIISLTYLFAGQTTFDNRLHAFYLSPNHLAMFIAPLIFIAFTNVSNSNKLIKYFSTTTIILASLVLFFTNSFSSSIAFIFTLLILVFILVKRKVLLSIFIFFAILITIFVGYHKISNINQDFSKSSMMSRYEIWTVSKDHIQKNTLVNNSGIDNFRNLYLDAQSLYKPYLHWSAPTPHNLLLTLWISGGFFTVLFFCLLCSRWLYITISNYKKTKNATILFYIAAFLTILITSLLDTPFWKNDLSIIFWIILLFNISKF